MASGYGLVTINGVSYAEREQTFPLEQAVTTNNAVYKQSLVLPGVADFWLKSLVRTTIVSGANVAKAFRFRLGNSDGTTWYQSAGNGGSTDRILDTNIFGTASFPKILNPYIYYGSSSSILWEIEDVTGAATGTPYTVVIAFGGSYLIPVSS